MTNLDVTEQSEHLPLLDRYPLSRVIVQEMGSLKEKIVASEKIQPKKYEAEQFFSFKDCLLSLKIDYVGGNNSKTTMMVSLDDASAVKHEYLNEPNNYMAELGEHTLSVFKIVFRKYPATILSNPLGITRPDYEGQGMMTGILSSLPSIMEMARIIDPNYFDRMDISVWISDQSSALNPERSHKGYASAIAKELGFNFLWNRSSLDDDADLIPSWYKTF